MTVYNQAPATRGLFDVVYDNYPERNNDFHGVDVNFNKRMSQRWMVMGGLSLGKNTGDTYTDTSDLNNPNFTFRNGVLDSDVPVSFKLSGIYDAPLGIRLSGSYQHYTGFPEATTVQVTSQTVALNGRRLRPDCFRCVRPTALKPPAAHHPTRCCRSR